MLEIAALAVEAFSCTNSCEDRIAAHGEDKVKTKYMVCARRIVRDADENDISIFGVFENMELPGFPVVLPRLSAVWTVVREEGDAEVTPATVKLTLGDDTLAAFDVNVDFQGKEVTRVMMTVGGVSLKGPGDLKLTCFVNNVEVASYLIEIKAKVTVGGGAVPPGGFIAG